jgi:xanthine dehydrogenase molybdopterin-binding subunit B
MLTHSASTVQIPSMGDAPAELNVRLLDDVLGDAGAAQRDVVHGSKAVGEPPLMLAFAVREALRDAIAAFRDPQSDPNRREPIALPSPLTHEQLYRAVRAVRSARDG